MAINFPGSLDNGTSLPNPSAGSAPNNPSHAGLHDNENAAIIALETKLGTGSATPSNNTVLVGNGSGSSTWATTLSGLTLSSPTINTPTFSAGGVQPAALATGIQTSKFSNPYKFAAWRNSAQSLTDGAWNKVNFDTKEYDTGSNYDASTNYRFTAPVNGFYHFAGVVTVATATASTLFGAALYKNGSQYINGFQGNTSSATAADTSYAVGGDIQLSTNDYVELWVYNGGTGKSLKVGQIYYCRLSGHLISVT